MIVEEIDSVVQIDFSSYDFGNGHGNSDGYGFGSEEADDYLPF